MNTVGRAAVGFAGLVLWAGVTSSAPAQTPTQLSPPASAPTPPASKPAAPSPPRANRPRRHRASPRRPRRRRRRPIRAPGLDMAYGAFQRGHYVTAFSIATQRVNEQKDVKAMTLLGELYANGLGVERDDKKAAEWYGRAVERGDREAMFALAMLQLAGRDGGSNSEQGAKLLAAAAKLGHATRRLQSRPAVPRGPNVSARFWPRGRTVPRRGAGRPPGSPIRARDPVQRRARRGQGFDRSRPPSRPRRPVPTTPMRKSNMPSRCSTEREARNEMSGWRRRCWRKRHARATPSRKTVSPIFLRSAAVCRPMRWRRSSGTSSPKPAASATFRSTHSCRSRRRRPAPPARRRQSPGSTRSRSSAKSRS